MQPTPEAHTADRAIASLRKAIEELAAGRPRQAQAMVANAAGSVAALREMVDRQILKQPGTVQANYCHGPGEQIFGEK